jgi:penicillin-binding protein 2
VNRHARNGKPQCWIYKMHPGVTHGSLDLFGGLKHSCNIYFVEVGHRLGPQRLADWFVLFGFGRSPQVGLSPNEQSAGMLKRSGLPLPEAWFMAIGQGGLSATPLQVAAAHATIARDGLYLSPRVSLEHAPKQIRRQTPITPDQAQVVRRGMHAVVHDSDGGTAYKHWRDADVDLDVEIGGKTGTAAVTPLKIDTDGDGTRDRVVADGDHAWFAGFAPYRQPQIAFAVILEYAGSGGRNAAPVAKEALRICEEYGYLRK